MSSLRLQCEFQPPTAKGGRCIYCGWELPTDFESSPKKACVGCSNLGSPIEQDGVTVRVKCICGGNRTEIFHTAHSCSVHNRCLPTLIPANLEEWNNRKPESDLYHLCHGCEERETHARL